MYELKNVEKTGFPTMCKIPTIPSIFQGLILFLKESNTEHAKTLKARTPVSKLNIICCQ